jgi:hypothetical protein
MDKNDLQNKRLSNTERTKTGGELVCSGGVSRFCSICGTRRVTYGTNPMISHECGEDHMTTRIFLPVAQD